MSRCSTTHLLLQRGIMEYQVQRRADSPAARLIAPNNYKRTREVPHPEPRTRPLGMYDTGSTR
jgi:hypothetical protein